ncbi:MAG: NAD(+)/NADH kinase [Acetatifactor sp.]
MKHFLVYTNRHKDKNMAVTGRICSYLGQRGKKVSVLSEDGLWQEQGACTESEGTGEMPPEGDCMLVLGGDGTVLQAVRETIGHAVPILGVNLGTLGYMTETEPSELESALDRLIAGDYETESRMMLTGKVLLKNGEVRESWALNDIVFARSGSLQILKFNIYVNGQFLNSYDADGMIVTTPTGSTGYNLSAGGPIVEPKACLIVLTPICPHSLNQRSIVLSSDDCIEIEIPQGREDRHQTTEVSFDGNYGIPLNAGDRIRIVRSDMVATFIRLNRINFLEVLHRKMSD